MKVILGDCSDIPENLAEPTLTSTPATSRCRSITCIEVDEHCARAAHCAGARSTTP